MITSAKPWQSAAEARDPLVIFHLTLSISHWMPRETFPVSSVVNLASAGGRPGKIECRQSLAEGTMLKRRSIIKQMYAILSNSTSIRDKLVETHSDGYHKLMTFVRYTLVINNNCHLLWLCWTNVNKMTKQELWLAYGFSHDCMWNIVHSVKIKIDSCLRNLR